MHSRIFVLDDLSVNQVENITKHYQEIDYIREQSKQDYNEDINWLSESFKESKITFDHYHNGINAAFTINTKEWLRDIVSEYDKAFEKMKEKAEFIVEDKEKLFFYICGRYDLGANNFGFLFLKDEEIYTEEEFVRCFYDDGTVNFTVYSTYDYHY